LQLKAIQQLGEVNKTQMAFLFQVALERAADEADKIHAAAASIMSLLNRYVILCIYL
jgi:hypothetical protein